MVLYLLEKFKGLVLVAEIRSADVHFGAGAGTRQDLDRALLAHDGVDAAGRHVHLGQDLAAQVGLVHPKKCIKSF